MLFTCLEIFFARIIDVSISTFRTMIMVKKKSLIIHFLAFCEVFVWFIAARKALNTDIDSVLIPICYSLGYATGTYIGSFLSRKIIKNVNSVEVTTWKNNEKLIKGLHSLGYSVSIIELKSGYDEQEKELLLIDVRSKNTNEIIKYIKSIDEKAFIVVRDTKIVHNGYIK